VNCIDRIWVLIEYEIFILFSRIWKFGILYTYYISMSWNEMRGISHLGIVCILFHRDIII
jgi:hypothetical protein